MKIGVVGLGVVGDAVRHGLERIGHQVLGHDIRLGTSISDVLDTEVCFICVPTPQNADGSCDTSKVESVLDELYAAEYMGLATIKSTVPPGTTERFERSVGYMAPLPAGSMSKYLRLAFCPEFLRERAAVVDFVENHDLCVIGVHDDADFELLRVAHGGLPRHVARLTPTEAELAKYYSNVFNALRIVFANEFFEVCKAVGADYGAIKAAMVKRSTITDAYLDCNERYRGFGGVCLPKDTAAFAAFVRGLGIDMRLFDTIVDENKKFATTVPAGMRP